MSKKFREPINTLNNVLPDIEEMDEKDGTDRAKVYKKAIECLEKAQP